MKVSSFLNLSSNQIDEVLLILNQNYYYYDCEVQKISEREINIIGMSDDTIEIKLVLGTRIIEVFDKYLEDKHYSYVGNFLTPNILAS